MNIQGGMMQHEPRSKKGIFVVFFAFQLFLIFVIRSLFYANYSGKPISPNTIRLIFCCVAQLICGRSLMLITVDSKKAKKPLLKGNGNGHLQEQIARKYLQNALNI